jgi:predicted AlkP superfamily phosphohydrolase/phosphomutase
MTGKQSGEHGIFGFIDLEPGTYKMHFPNYLDIKASTLWDALASYHKKSIVINMPATYPAREINGALISGFVAIDLNKAVYPHTLIPKLDALKYRIDIDTAKARYDPEFLFRDLAATLGGRQRAVDLLWQEIDWDLFILVITGTDRLMHFLWTAYEYEDHSYHQAFLEYFKKVDDFIGRIYDRFLGAGDPQSAHKQFYMLSDHGFCGVKTEVYLNRWLQENRYLTFQKDPPETIMDIGPGSTAFALDPSRIYINLKEKYPLGTVGRADYGRLCQELKKGLQNLTFNDGNPVVKNVYLKEEIYHGPHLEAAPDLVVLSYPGYDLKGKVNSSQIFNKTDLQGMHTQDDAFFYSTTGDACKRIFDVRNIIQRGLRLPKS